MQEFSSKRDALFASLDNASKELKGTGLDQTKSKPYTINALERGTNRQTSQTMNYRKGCSLDPGNKQVDDKLRRLRGKESLFTKPELPIGRCLKPRKTPDYQVNPHKWKKYSLADVDISDQTNTAAALSFLKQMDSQREASASDNDEGHEPGTPHKFEFKKNSKLNRNIKQLRQQEVNDVEIDKPQQRGFKLVMPEYVIGQKSAKNFKKPQRCQNRAVAGQLQLSHLEKDEDE